MALPPVAVATDIMEGVMYINYKKQGWSERFILGNIGGVGTDPPTYGAARTLMAAGCLYRSYTLGNGCQIVWSRVSLFRRKKDRVAAIDGPVDPVNLAGEGGVVETIDNPKTGLLWSFEDLAGHYNERIMRGLRDGWVSDFSFDTSTLFPTIPVHTAAYAATTPGTTTATQAIFNWLLWQIKSTVSCKITGPTQTTFDLKTNERVLFRYVGSRDVGRPFSIPRGKAPARA